MVMISLVLLVFAFVLFVIAAFNVPATSRWNLVAGGLAFWVASELLTGFGQMR
jgi:hypothetical protein